MKKSLKIHPKLPKMQPRDKLMVIPIMTMIKPFVSF